jgi:gliding motility-associated-like protein
MVNPNNTTTYFVTVTSPLGCTSVEDLTITVNPVPVTTIIASSAYICYGDTAGLSAQTDIPVILYMWSTAETSQSIAVAPTTPTTYSVTTTTIDGCTGTADIQIGIYDLPDVSITSMNSDICLGNDAILSAQSNHPGTSYLWSTGNTNNTITVSPPSTESYYLTGTDINGCMDTSEFLVTVHPLPDVNVTSNGTSVCEGLSITLYGNSTNPGTNYLWSTNETTDSIQVTPPSTTTYYITGTDDNGCTGTNRITIQVNPNPDVNVNPNGLTICPGESLDLIASSPTATLYEWNTGQTTPIITITPSQTSTYSVTGTDDNGCIGIATALVVVRDAPNVDITPASAVVCEGESVTLIATGATLYDWTPGESLNTSVGAVVIATPVTSTTYYVSGIDLYGCEGWDSVHVRVSEIPDVDFIADQNNICMATLVHFSGQSSSNIASWSWDFGDPSSGSSNNSSLQNPMHTYFETGTYTTGLEVTNADGCKNSIYKPSFITVHPNPIASFSRTPDITTMENPTIQFYNQSLGAKSLLWNFDDPGSGLYNMSVADNPTHTYSMEGEFWATLFVENEWGCLDSVSNRIIINPDWDEFIPSAFTPNGDGNNDYFKPYGFNIDFTEFTMFIFDRWGKQIFEAHDINDPWDGRVNREGEIVQQDVYVYLIILKDITGLEHQFIGHVTLIK